MSNFILLTDSYKVSHWLQYPPHTQYVYSYLESRGGSFPEVMFFGLQSILKKYFLGRVVSFDSMVEAKNLFKNHFGDDYFNWSDWEYIWLNHNGHLPLRIRAVPEGLCVPPGNVLMTVENTDPRCAWLTNYVESLLMHVWYPCTVASQSRDMKKILLSYLEMTGVPGGVEFKLHDFGFRGSTSVESAKIGGLAHLVNFRGTDTAPVFEEARHYHCDMPGFSIPAAEHSTITSWGVDRECDAYANMLEQFPTGLVAVVSDSYNIYHAVTQIWGNKLKDLVLNRDGCLVIRPDSGDAATVLPTLFRIAAERFGSVENSKGYRIINPKVRFIQGDGIDRLSLLGILESIAQHGWSADNLAFGSGGGLLQKVNRDTCKFAIKCSSITIDGEEHDVYKSPVDQPDKKSKKGRLSLVKRDDKYVTIRTSEKLPGETDLLRDVYLNGKLLVDYTLEDVRGNAG